MFHKQGETSDLKGSIQAWGTILVQQAPSKAHPPDKIRACMRNADLGHDFLFRPKNLGLGVGEMETR